MEPLDVVTSTYLSCLVDVVGLYSGAAAEARVMTAGCPEVGAPEETIATLVRFGEERLWGSSLLVAAEGTVRRLSDDGACDPTDWLGELNNQLVGRLKNRLLPVGIALQVSPPVPVVGFVKGRGAAAGWEVTWLGGRLAGVLGLTVSPGVVLAAEATLDVAAEGSLVLF